MTVTHLIDTVAEWARLNICDKIQLKQAPADMEAAEDQGYEYRLVNPAVFPMYVPTSDKLPPNVHAPFPSLCVRFAKGADNMKDREGGVVLQFCFSAWNPGIHGEDILLPDGKGGHTAWSGEDADSYFQKCGAGWRDVWNFADIALRALESVTHIGGYAIDHATPIEFGPLAEQEAIPDYYPHWFAWVSFRVTYPLRRNIEDFQNLL